MRRIGLLAVSALGLASACVIRQPDPMPLLTPQYGLAPADAGVGEPSPYEVSSMPPEPLYEQMSDSPGDGFVWIDGYWHWNGYEWVWVGGRWEREQEGYAYVAPYYAYDDGAYIYTPGYWRRSHDVPRGWVTSRGGNGRPPTVRPPASYHPPLAGVGMGAGVRQGGGRGAPTGGPGVRYGGPPAVGQGPARNAPEDLPTWGGPRYPAPGREPGGRQSDVPVTGGGQRSGVIETEHAPIYAAPEGGRDGGREGEGGRDAGARAPEPGYGSPGGSPAAAPGAWSGGPPSARGPVGSPPPPPSRGPEPGAYGRAEPVRSAPPPPVSRPSGGGGSPAAAPAGSRHR